jgi:hypothetical protein
MFRLQAQTLYSLAYELLMCREIMHAMWKPVRYKYVYLACTIYVLFITVPHSVALYWSFGDALLVENNALGHLPVSNARSAALIFMIIHQVTQEYCPLKNSAWASSSIQTIPFPFFSPTTVAYFPGFLCLFVCLFFKK